MFGIAVYFFKKQILRWKPMAPQLVSITDFRNQIDQNFLLLIQRPKIIQISNHLRNKGTQHKPTRLCLFQTFSVQDAVAATVKEFGGIDILVNNASAIQLTGTLQTNMKRLNTYV